MNNDDHMMMPPALVGVRVSITLTTAAGSSEFAAQVSVQDRTRTGIRDALAAAGEEAQERYDSTLKTDSASSGVNFGSLFGIDPKRGKEK